MCDMKSWLSAPSEICTDRTRAGVMQIDERGPSNEKNVRISIPEGSIVLLV